jgi:hypothetical protein
MTRFTILYGTGWPCTSCNAVLYHKTWRSMTCIALFGLQTRSCTTRCAILYRIMDRNATRYGILYRIIMVKRVMQRHTQLPMYAAAEAEMTGLQSKMGFGVSGLDVDGRRGGRNLERLMRPTV